MKSKDDLIAIIMAGTKARNDIRTYIKNNKSAPKKRIDSLKEFQKLDGNLDVDGYYGPNSEAALKYYLKDMPDNEVPASHKIYADTEITWQKPSIIQPKQEAVTAKSVVKSKPKTKSVTTKKSSLASFSNLKTIKPKKKKIVTESKKKAIEEITKSPDYGVDEIISTNKFDAENLISKQDIKKMSSNIEKSNKEVLATLKSIKKRVDDLKNFEGMAVTKKGNLRLLGLIL
jgi:hypothetical protein